LNKSVDYVGAALLNTGVQLRTRWYAIFERMRSIFDHDMMNINLVFVREFVILSNSSPSLC